ncbi:ent-copalyl diphosphate synthase 1 [Magnolia sinica]|uniref:ent-copalyl diphosphate synthase 1 n=1 Tax=Magnolia sinica TaxID=86752 RepID=UPI0026588B11|nr:ent-copalyl diphosphate synthase 1 [Magnolia sinica]
MTLPTALLHFPLSFPAFRYGSLSFPTLADPTEPFSVCSFGVGWKPAYVAVPSSRCNAVSKPRVMHDILQNNTSVIKWPETLPDTDDGKALTKVPESNEITQRIDAIKEMLRSMDDGEISVSAYDTAWVALVDDMHGSGEPQFPTSLQWIVENQLPDGSWGDERIFSAHDRILNTLACVIALKSWNIYPKRCISGLSFLRENLKKLQDENAEHMPIGFEVAFPSLIEIARSLDLEFPYDSPLLQDIYAMRNFKLKRIPKEIMHKVPTTLLHSLEGMHDLDWEKLLKLQSADGSFLFSPSSTAFALKQTKDEKCLKYLQKAVENFNGGVPNVYPVDLFEHIWAVDRLERLGISRYFEAEIKDCLDYVYRYWTEDGICWARNSRVRDVDDTAMGFRILRLHGYDVSADAFRHFENGGEFFCFSGQSNQAVTGIFNLNRASQISFPGEKILEEAKSFSDKFLREKQASKQLLDKWIITKDLPGEVGYALDFPWYTSLPRIETRFYLEQYGGEDDVWIGKTLYRMPYVNNNVYLELAKLDFNQCQALHQLEWREIEKWYVESVLMNLGLSENTVLQAYFLAAVSIFEPEKSTERLAWAQTAVLMDAISSYFGTSACSSEKRRAFLQDFNDQSSGSKRTRKGLVGSLLETLRHLSLDALVVHGSDVHCNLLSAWETWLLTWQGDGDSSHHQRRGAEAELLVRTINLCAGRSVSENLLSHPQYVRLARRTNGICDRLRRVRKLKEQRANGNDAITSSGLDTKPIESEMQELMQCVLQSSDGIDSYIKQTFLTVAKSFYYAAHCPLSTFNYHISKVLFDRAA